MSVSEFFWTTVLTDAGCKDLVIPVMLEVEREDEDGGGDLMNST